MLEHIRSSKSLPGVDRRYVAPAYIERVEIATFVATGERSANSRIIAEHLASTGRSSEAFGR